MKNYPKYGFSFGTHVWVDGRDEAVVQGYYPMGSALHLWPHYSVRFVGGPKHEYVKVPIDKVSLKPTEKIQ